MVQASNILVLVKHQDQWLNLYQSDVVPIYKTNAICRFNLNHYVFFIRGSAFTYFIYSNCLANSFSILKPKKVDRYLVKLMVYAILRRFCFSGQALLCEMVINKNFWLKLFNLLNWMQVNSLSCSVYCISFFAGHYFLLYSGDEISHFN